MKKQKIMVWSMLVMIMLCAFSFTSVEAREAPRAPFLNYLNRELSNLEVGMEYGFSAINATPATWTAVTETKITITEDMQKDDPQLLHIRYAAGTGEGALPASDSMTINIPKKYTADDVKAEFDPADASKQPKFDCAARSLTVNEEGKYAITTDAEKSKYTNLTGNKIALSSLVKAGNEVVRVKIYADNDKERFETPYFEYNVYTHNPNSQNAPDIEGYLFDTDEDIFKGKNEADYDIKNLEYTYDTSTDWKKFGASEHKMSTKIGAKAFDMHIRTAPTTDKRESTPISIKFEAREDMPDIGAAGFDLDKETFSVTSSYVYRTKTGSVTTDWKTGEGKAIAIGSIKQLHLRREGSAAKGSAIEKDEDRAKYAMVVSPQSSIRTITMPVKGAAPSVSYVKSTTRIKNVVAGMQFYVSTKDLTEFKGVSWNEITSGMIIPGTKEMPTSQRYLPNGLPSTTESYEKDGVTMYGKYLYIRSAPVKSGATLKLASKPKKIYIPDKQDPIDSNTVKMDYVTESMLGLNKTMEYRILKFEKKTAVDSDTGQESEYFEVTNPNQKYSSISKTSLPLTTHLNKMPADENWYICIRKKASGSGTKALMASEEIMFQFPHRPEAPAATTLVFNPDTLGINEYTVEENPTLKAEHKTDDDLQAFDFSTNNKTWKKYTMANLLKSVPKYTAKGTTKKLYIRYAGTNEDTPSYASQGLQLNIPCRQATPKFKLQLAPTTSIAFGDAYIPIADPENYAVSVDNGENWTVLDADITFGPQGNVPVGDTAVAAQIKRVASATNPESLPQKIKFTRAKAPKPAVNYSAETFKGVTAKHQYRIANSAAALENAEWVDVSKDNLMSADGKKVLINYEDAAISDKYFQFRVKATGTKLASRNSAALHVGKRATLGSTAISTLINYEDEVLTVNSGDQAEYKIGLKEGMKSKEKWVKVPKKGEINLTKILDSTDVDFGSASDSATNEAKILFRYPASKTEPASKPITFTLRGRPEAKFNIDISYDYENETTAHAVNTDIEFSFNGKKWQDITADLLAENGSNEKVLKLPATNKTQKVYFRAGATAKAFRSKAHTSVMIIPGRAKAPTYVNGWIDMSADNPAIILPDDFEFMVEEHSHVDFANKWLSADGSGVALIDADAKRTIYNGENDVIILVRRKGDNTNRTVPSNALEVKIAKQKAAPKLKFSAATNMISGAIKNTMQYGLVAKGGAEKDIVWETFTASDQSAKKLLLGAFPEKGSEQDVYVRHKATVKAYHSLAVQIGTTMAEPAKPSGLSYDAETGKVGGATTMMEFSLDKVRWTAVKKDGMSFKVYETSSGQEMYFRYKATSEQPASKCSDTVLIKAASAPQAGSSVEKEMELEILEEEQPAPIEAQEEEQPEEAA